MIDRDDILLASLGIAAIAFTAGWEVALPVVGYLSISAYLRYRYAREHGAR